MFTPLLTRDIYEIYSPSTPLHGVMLRGRIRKFGLEQKRNVLTENSGDKENCVLFAVPSGEDPSAIIHYLESIVPDVSVEKVLTDLPNPILSKLKTNQEERYTL